MSMSNELSSLSRKKEDENFFIRVLKYFFPWKGDNLGEVIRKFVFMASIVFFCISINGVMDYFKVDVKELEMQKQIAQLAPDFDFDTDAPQQDKNGDVIDDNLGTTVSPQWSALLEKNKDTIGWFSIPTYVDDENNPYINFPVMFTERQYLNAKGEYEDFYLKHDFYEKYNQFGTLYLDWRVPVNSATDHADNITIYGHHMKATGRMFTRLHEYKANVDFLKQNPLLSFDTIYTKNQKYIIVSCFVSSVDPEQDNGELFAYWQYRNFDEEHTFESFMDNINKRSWYSSNIDCNEDDDFITLSTCTNEVGNSKLRWVMIARRVRPSDDIEALVASYAEKADSDIYFPRVWINRHGNKKVYLGWQY
ncbi:MAG: class B sortase [Clostridiales bacterium]|nr:class B sortase [Clostridiales bacterium]